MKKSIVMLTALVSLTAHAELLSCRSDSYNPSYKLVLDRDSSTKFYGNLSRDMVGFASTETKNLGTANMIIKLNPSNCEVRISSEKNADEQFLMKLDLHNISSDSVKGQISGSAVINAPVTCGPLRGDFIQALKAVCDTHSSEDTLMVFKSGLEVVNRIDSKSISQNQTVKEVPASNDNVMNYYFPGSKAVGQ